MFYYKQENGIIVKSTQNAKIAKKEGLDKSTNEKIVTGYDGRLYLESDCPPLPEPTYAQKRLAEYPDIGEQLDMIYWDKINGTNLWQTKINEIKTKYSKN